MMIAALTFTLLIRYLNEAAVRSRAAMTGAYRPDTRYARAIQRHLEVALKVPVVRYPLMNIRPIGRRCCLAALLLMQAALSLAQDLPLDIPLLPNEPLISVSTPIADFTVGGDSGGLNGVNLTPDVFGITDLLAPGESGEPGFSNNCEGVACGDSEISIIELPGLSLNKANPSSQNCTDTDKDGICDENDECLGTPLGIAVLASGCGLSPNAPIILSGVNFSPNSTALSRSARAYLDEVVALIRELSSPLLIIEGHTDSQGSEADNLTLSLSRAESVFNYLTKSGVPKEKLAYRGLGEAYPLTSSRRPDGQSVTEAERINRRIELKLADTDEFEQVRAEMQAREDAIRLAQERAARERKLRESEKLRKQEKVEAAEQGYSEVLEFLEQTGSAQSPASSQQSESNVSSEASGDESYPEYKIEFVDPDE